MLELSELIGSEIVDAGGRAIGRLRDLAVAPAAQPPAVARLLVSAGRKDVPRPVSWSEVIRFETRRIELRSVGLPASAEHPDELLLARDVLDVQIFDAEGRRFARVGDVRLLREGQVVRIVGVEVGLRPTLRRLGLGHVAQQRQEDVIPWSQVQLTSGHGHAVQLRHPHIGPQRLDPGQLASLVAGLPTSRGAEIVRSVSPELAASALSYASPHVAGRLVAILDPGAAARIVEQMPADDGAAALRRMTAGTRAVLLAQVESIRADELRRLLAHPAKTAAGLMNPSVVTASIDDDVDAIIRRVREAAPQLDALMTVFVTDGEGALLGAIPPRRLVGGDVRPDPSPAVPWNAPIDTVVGLFALHDILALPVLDDRGHIMGAVAIDDIIEELLAERLPGRRRFWRRPGRRG